METTKKNTRATFKSFIRKNAGNLHINVKSDFDGMVDCVMPSHRGFRVAQEDTREYMQENNVGILGVWLVGGRDWFKGYEDDTYKGIEVSNCCGNFIVAIRK